MAGIYNRDNIGSMLMTGLENALRRRNERTKTENARIADNVKAINSFVKSAGYADSDDLDDKLNQLKMERIAAQKAQEDANQAVIDANERSLVAEQNMQGYRPSSVGFPDTETSAYQSAMMEGYRPATSFAMEMSRQPRELRGPEAGRYMVNLNPDYADVMRDYYTGQGIPATAMQDFVRVKVPKHIRAMQNYGKGVY